MGLVESKKDGIIKKYELKINLQAEIKKEFLQLYGWSFADIKNLYDSYCRKSDCPYLQFFTFHKIMPFSIDVSRWIFDSYVEGEKFVNIFQILCMLILVSHNNYRKKLQFFFVLFDFDHSENLSNREIMLLFESIVNGFCRLTGEPRPSYTYLNKYTVERFIRVNSLEALQKIVNYRRLIEQVEGNNDVFELFKRFNEDIYDYFTQESYLFRVNQYKKYSRQEIQKIYRIIKKVCLDKNYDEVEMVDKNKKFRLQNRKMQCLKNMMEQKAEKFKTKQITGIKGRSNSMVMRASALPALNRQTESTYKFNLKKEQKIPISLTSRSKSLKLKKMLILNGKITSKEDIFETIKYFKSLSSNKSQIKIKQFIKSFEKKPFFKTQVTSLFKYFDKGQKGEISFQEFIKVYYRNITKADIEAIKEWFYQFKQIHEADNFDINQFGKKKEKKVNMELPYSTVARIDEIFNSIDRGRKGYLVIEDLKKAYNTGFSIKQLEEMMKQFGKNNKLYKEEFIKMTLPEEWTIEGTDFVGA